MVEGGDVVKGRTGVDGEGTGVGEGVGEGSVEDAIEGKGAVMRRVR